VGWNGSNWLVAWNTELENDRYESDIHAVRVSPDGVVLDQQPMVIGTHLPNPYGSDDIDPTGPLSLVSNGSDWFVTWRRHNPNIGGGIGMEWFATRVLANGTVPDPQGTNILTANQYADDFGLAFSSSNGGQFMHLYSWNDQTFQRRFDTNMNLIAGSERPAVFADGADFSIAGGPDGWLASWEGRFVASPQVQAARIASDGSLIDAAPLQVTGPSYGVDFSVDGEWNGVDWTVAYSNFPTAGGTAEQDIFARRVSPTAPSASALGPVVDLIVAPAHQSDPRLISSGNGGYKILYEDHQSETLGIAVAVVSPTDQLLAQRDVSIAAPSQGPAEFASDGSNLLALYASSTGYGTRLLATRMTAGGQPLDQEPLELAAASLKPGSYEIVYLGGRYVATFNATNGPQGNQIYARTINSDGSLGLITALMPNAPLTGFSLSNASVNGDRLILVGNANEGNGHRSSRFGRIFDANLAPVSARFIIGYGFALSGDTEAVNGGWVSTWANKPSHDAPRSTIYYSVVGLNGTLIQSDTAITSNYPGNGTPTVVSNGGAAATEAMVIYPQSRDAVYPQIVNEDALRARRIAASGATIGGQITLIDQPRAQARVQAVFNGTDYVLTWTDQRNYPYPAQERDDVFAARVTVDGTVIDQGGFAVADSFRPEFDSTIGVVNDQVLFAYRSFRHEAPFASYRLATRSMSDQTGPTLIGEARFEFERDQAVSFRFDRELVGVDPADLLVQNLTTGQTIPSGQFTVEAMPAGSDPWTYRWKYNGILPNGSYRATLAAGSVTDLNGVPNGTDIIVEFNVMMGDADGNGIIDGDDYVMIDNGFNNQLSGWSNGDFNYDGVVDGDDYVLIDFAFNTQ
jgi:hypothetical protein